MTNTKVSVILTSYNHARYLRETIDSVLNQTFSDFELIIWDDASTDESWEIISNYTDPRIRAFRNRINTGSGNINKAILEKALGEYIAIHHSDDTWLPQKLEKQVGFLEENQHVGAIFSNAFTINENGDPLEDKAHFYYDIFDQPNRNRFEWLNFFFYHGNALCHSSVLIRRKCYEHCGLYKDGLNQIDDFDMWIRLCLKYDIYVLQEKLVRFLVHSNEMNTSGNRPDVRIRSQFELLQAYNNYRDIRTLEELTNIFPTAKKYIRQGDIDLGFALGMVALDIHTPNMAKLFGLNLIFEALNNPDRARKLNGLYEFTHSDFIGLTAKYDVFSVQVVTDLTQANTAYELMIQKLTNDLSRITNSRTWKVVYRTRTFLMPQGSYRERVALSIMRALIIWRNEGFGNMMKKLFDE